MAQRNGSEWKSDDRREHKKVPASRREEAPSNARSRGSLSFLAAKASADPRSKILARKIEAVFCFQALAL